jgi:hypothetical protein
MQSTTSNPHSAKRRRTQPSPTASAADDLDSDDESRFYDPTQDQHERQEVKKKSRALEREFNGACTWSLYSDPTRSNITQKTEMSTLKTAVSSSP